MTTLSDGKKKQCLNQNINTIRGDTPCNDPRRIDHSGNHILILVLNDRAGKENQDKDQSLVRLLPDRVPVRGVSRGLTRGFLVSTIEGIAPVVPHDLKVHPRPKTAQATVSKHLGALPFVRKLPRR